MVRAATVGVLVVDDHDQFVAVLETILAGEADFDVVGRASNGEEAVDAVARLAPDVVLMDISMPVLDGFEATRRIRSDHPSTSVIMLTGSDSEEDRAAAHAVGAFGYVTKERVLDELPDVIRSAAEGARLS